jgi:hypothetical protein
MVCIVEIAAGGMICMPTFMTIDSGIQVILRLLPQKFKRLTVGITDREDFRSMPLRWPQVARYAYQAS